jgi:flagella basal body P-ring formation protein FlgA
MIRTITLAALIAAAALAGTRIAAAQVAAAPASVARASMPTLRHAATVSGDIVRIGDLIDNAGAAADAPIFRSPDAGTTGAVSVQQVLDAIRPYHIYLVDTESLSEVEVTRAGRTIDVAAIEARIARTFAGRYGLGEAKNLVVTLDSLVRPITVETTASVDLALMGSALDPRSGRFEATFDIPGNFATRRSLRLTGTVVETVPVAVTAQALARGALIKSSDVAIERRPKAQVPADALGSDAQVVGLAVRQATPAGQPLRRGELTKPEMVHRDDNVTLVYEVPGILLTTRGKALEAGAEGDTISVVNTQTKQTIQGIVSGPNRVTITASTARVTTAAAVPAR